MQGFTILHHLTVSRGSLKLLQYVLDKGADVNATGPVSLRFCSSAQLYVAR